MINSQDECNDGIDQIVDILNSNLNLAPKTKGQRLSRKNFYYIGNIYRRINCC